MSAAATRPSVTTELDAYSFLTPHLPPTVSPHTTRPFLTLTYAQSLDAFIASAACTPLALSSPSSLIMTHALRTMHDAILVGVDTIISDNPSLNTRFVQHGPRGAKIKNPRPVILDSRLRAPVDAKIFGPGRHPIVITTEVHNAARKAQLEFMGATVLTVASNPTTGRVDISSALTALRGKGIASIMVEGGATVIGTLLTDDTLHIDLLVVTVAPKLVGKGVHAMGTSIDDQIKLMPELKDIEWKQFGVDMVMLAKVATHNETK